MLVTRDNIQPCSLDAFIPCAMLCCVAWMELWRVLYCEVWIIGGYVCFLFAIPAALHNAANARCLQCGCSPGRQAGSHWFLVGSRAALLDQEPEAACRTATAYL